MAFRYNEAEESGREHALTYLVKSLSPEYRKESESQLQLILDKFGPVVDAYPTWHPIVASNYNGETPETYPCGRSGYSNLDHTINLRNAFITCPYGGAEEVIKSVERLESRDHLWATIEAEELDFKLYNDGATPVLVKCNWHGMSETDGTIPKRFVVARMLEQELPGWCDADVGETWETMRPYFLGRPCGARSSMFVSQETGQKMKNVWNAVLNAGVFGPIMV